MEMESSGKPKESLRAKAQRVFSRPDPTATSRILNIKEELSDWGEENDRGHPVRRKGLFEKFHEVGKYPETQQFVSRLFKPFLHVSDVVRAADGKWYSHEPPIRRVGHKTEAAEIVAEQQILKHVMGDADHTFIREKGRNLKRSHGRHLYYDFDGARHFFTSPQVDIQLFEHWVQEFASPEERAYYQDLLPRMETFYKSVEGRELVEAVFRASGKEIKELFTVSKYAANQDPSFEDFYALFLARIGAMRKTAEALAAGQHH